MREWENEECVNERWGNEQIPSPLQFILYFISSWCKIASVARNWINSAPKYCISDDIVFFFEELLLLWLHSCFVMKFSCSNMFFHPSFCGCWQVFFGFILSSSAIHFLGIDKYVTYLLPTADRKGGQHVFVENWTNYDPIRTCFVYDGGVMTGRRAGSGVEKYMQWAQDRAAKGSTSSRRRSTFPIWVYYLSSVCLHVYPTKQIISHKN